MTEKPSLPLEEFYRKLEGFDWYFEMSDDPSVYNQGRRGLRELADLAKASGPEYLKMLKDWRAFASVSIIDPEAIKPTLKVGTNHG
jgi:hypothetical protein